MRTSWRHNSRSDLLPSSDSVPHHTPSHKPPSPNPGETPVWFIPAEFRPRINDFCRCLSSYPSINWHYSNHSCPHAQRHKQPPPPPQPSPPPLHEPTHSLHRESDFSPPQQPAGWVSPRLRPFTQPFSSRLLLTSPTLPHPACPATFPHTVSWLSFKIRSTLPPPAQSLFLASILLYPPFSMPNCLLHGKPGKAAPAPTHTYISPFCSTVLLFTVFSLLKDWLETGSCWVSMEEGCGWCRERDYLWLSTGDSLHFSSSLHQMDIRIVRRLDFLFIQLICKHCMWLNLTVNSVTI